MRFTRIERDDHALVLNIDFYVLHPGNVLQHRSQFAHALIAIFTFSGDFDRFQNSMVGSFREKRIGRIWISRSCRVHRVLVVSLSNARRLSPQGRGDRPQSPGGGSGEPPLPAATSRDTGSSTRQTFSARIFWPAAFG